MGEPETGIAPPFILPPMILPTSSAFEATTPTIDLSGKQNPGALQ
jgi:hypothetical protein